MFVFYGIPSSDNNALFTVSLKLLTLDSRFIQQMHSSVIVDAELFFRRHFSLMCYYVVHNSTSLVLLNGLVVIKSGAF